MCISNSKMREIERMWTVIVEKLDDVMVDECHCDCGCGLGDECECVCSCGAVEKLDETSDRYVRDKKIDYREMEDGTWEFDLPGYGNDDCDATVDGDMLKITLDNEYEEISFQIKMPSHVSSVNISFDKGVMSLAFVFDPSNVSVNFY